MEEDEDGRAEDTASSYVQTCCTFNLPATFSSRRKRDRK